LCEAPEGPFRQKVPVPFSCFLKEGAGIIAYVFESLETPAPQPLLAVPMLDPSHPIAQLLEADQRYPFEAYVFIFEALHYAQNVLNMGADRPADPASAPQSPKEEASDFDITDEVTETEHHVSGQELCEAIRQYALEQYGYMAKTVLNNWGIHGTGDFGEIVFNLIRVGQMRKTPSDTRIDFDNVYDFDSAFRQGFKISPP
jgi:uncharacterized repeat protein (TIGR04138 family)